MSWLDGTNNWGKFILRLVRATPQLLTPAGRSTQRFRIFEWGKYAALYLTLLRHLLRLHPPLVQAVVRKANVATMVAIVATVRPRASVPPTRTTVRRTATATGATSRFRA